MKSNESYESKVVSYDMTTAIIVRENPSKLTTIPGSELLNFIVLGINREEELHCYEYRRMRLPIYLVPEGISRASE